MNLDRDRMVSALNSGDSVRIPSGLNREEFREFILSHNKHGGKDMNTLLNKLHEIGKKHCLLKDQAEEYREKSS